MQLTLTTVILISGSVLAALLAIFGMAGALHVTSRREQGFMHLIFYATITAVAVGSLLSGRDLSSNLLAEEQTLPSVVHPVMIILQPFLSLLILAISGERIISHWLGRKQTHQPLLLFFFFGIFWISTIAAPALFSAHPQLSHDYVYPLVIGLAATLASGQERDQALKAARNAIFIFMFLGLITALIYPDMVLDRSYTQGLIPDLPRLAGLSPHPVGLGLLSQLGLLCLMACPYRHRWFNRLAWTIGLASLFLAQSKTAWLAFLICGGTLLAVQRGPAFWRRIFDPMHPAAGMMTLVGLMLSVVSIAAVLMFGELGARASAYMTSPEGALLTSLTGRDHIWAIAIDEWLRNPVFGYGPSIWDEKFRASIGMLYATNAHNQFMDTLSRSGTVGAIALLLYSILLLVMSLRYTRATQGLSLALFLALVLRAVSEVPLLMFGYSIDMLLHLLLLMVLTAATKEAHISYPSRPPMPVPHRSRSSVLASNISL